MSWKRLKNYWYKMLRVETETESGNDLLANSAGILIIAGAVCIAIALIIMILMYPDPAIAYFLIIIGSLLAGAGIFLAGRQAFRLTQTDTGVLLTIIGLVVTIFSVLLLQFGETYAFLVMVGILTLVAGVAMTVSGNQKEDEAKKRARADATRQTAIKAVNEQGAYLRHLTISVPAGGKWEPERALRLMQSLYGLRTYLHLSICAQNHEITWAIDVGRPHEETVARNIFAVYPRAQIDRQAKQDTHIGWYLFQMESETASFFPLKGTEDFKGLSPMSQMVSNLGAINTGEELAYEITLRPPSKNYRQIGEDIITAAANYTDAETKHYCKLIHDKIVLPMMDARLSIMVKAHEYTRAVEIAEFLQPALVMYLTENQSLNPARNRSYPLALTPYEASALWHLPTNDCQSAGIVWSKASSAPLPTALLRSQPSVRESVVLGVNTYQGESHDVRLGYPDRITHVNLVGRTRVGKSTLMHNMVTQDIANGKGVAVIDPHGDFVRDVLECSIPAYREDDVVLFDITDTDYPIGLNLLAVPDGIPIETGADQTLDVIRKMFASDWSSGRMENVLYASLAALVTWPHATIQDVSKMPINSEFRGEVLKRTTDITTLEYWYDIHEGLSHRAQLEVAQPIVNRIQRFYRNPTIRRVICQENSLDFTSILNGRKIFLANLGGLSDIESQTLGALLISKIQMAAMSRAQLEPDKRIPFYCYIDEVQNFVTTSLGKVFSEAAKYGLSLTVANQFLSQLTGDTLDAIIGNVGTTVMFRCGHDDARLLGRFIQPQFDAEALLNLDRFTTVINMQNEGETLSAFGLRTNPPPEKQDGAEAIVERIRTANRKKYARPREEIDKELTERYTGKVIEPEQETVPENGSDNVDDSFLG